MTAIEAAFANEQQKLEKEVGVSDWILVDQTMIDQFAETTCDDQWIHVDPERAKQTPFGGTIAHGFLTLSLASRFAYDALEPMKGQVMGVNYGFERLRFLTPVGADSLLRGRFQLKQVTRRSDTELLRAHVLSIEIEGAPTPALVAEWLTLSIFA